MKTIEIPDDMYEQLLGIANEIRTQDNRSTGTPYMFQIMEKKRIYGIDERFSYEGYIWRRPGDDGHYEDTREEMLEALSRNDEEEVDRSKETDDSLRELMEADGYEQVYFTTEDTFKNAFFTEKGIRRHMEANAHHYHEPLDYLNYCFRNPEMELMFKFFETIQNEL